MSFMAFFVEAVLVSLSGVMAPGLITTVSVGYGGEDPRAGAWVAVGHGLVEFPLMIAVFFGLGALMDVSWVKTVISLLGGGLLLFLGIDMLRGIRETEVIGEERAGSPLAAGAVLSLTNPYFLVWWATVGAGLILRSIEYGVLGFAAFALGHWLCDLAWDTFLSAAAFQGGKFLGRRFQQVILGISGSFLLFYSGKLIVDGLRPLLG